MPGKIEDYALIGDCETAALVCNDGSIDWLCWPAFDSEACFAALLGDKSHGRWRIAPASDSRMSREYRGETLILETRFETADGAVTLIDFMPPKGKYSDVMRIVVGIDGAVRLRSELVIRFDYGMSIPWVTRPDNGVFRAVAGPNMLILETPISLRGEHMKTIGEFTVSVGDKIPFVLTYAPSHLHAPKSPKVPV